LRNGSKVTIEFGGVGVREKDSNGGVVREGVGKGEEDKISDQSCYMGKGSKCKKSG